MWTLPIRTNWLKKNFFIFIIFFIIYIINRFLKPVTGIFILDAMLRNHLNDYIGGIFFCIYVNLLLLYSKKKSILKFKFLFLLMIIVSILWEYFFPLFLNYSTSDKYDILAYLLGTLTYYTIFYPKKFKK